jgi:single-stranded DNA-specific DHH superfamily exonuclease
MRTVLTTFITGGLLCCASVRAEDAKISPKNTSPDQVSIFQAPLQCPAAPQIGCGSRAKPMLLELERDSNVSEAWLNREGTKIAVVWKPETKAKVRQRVATNLKEYDATEIKGKSRDEAITEFLSGNGWYRGAEVDRLSEEEAGIIAARLVRRVEAKTTLPKEKAEALRHALTEALKKRFTDDKVKQDQDALLKSAGGLQHAAGQYLDADQIPVLKEAIASGLRPLPNEK